MICSIRLRAHAGPLSQMPKRYSYSTSVDMCCPKTVDITSSGPGGVRMLILASHGGRLIYIHLLFKYWVGLVYAYYWSCRWKGCMVFPFEGLILGIFRLILSLWDTFSWRRLWSFNQIRRAVLFPAADAGTVRFRFSNVYLKSWKIWLAAVRIGHWAQS